MTFARLTSRVAAGGAVAALAAAGLVGATSTSASAAPVTSSYTCNIPTLGDKTLTVSVDIALLQRSADAVLVRHPNLRVSFWDRDLPRPVQIVPSTVKIPWEFRSADAAELSVIAEAERRRHFDLAAGPSIRFLLVDVAPQRYRLICTAHHLIMDGWSVPVFVRATSSCRTG